MANWRITDRRAGTIQLDSEPVGSFISAGQLGAPGGVATLDGNSKIPRSQIQMAQETADKFAQIDAAMLAAPAGGGGVGPAGPKGDPGIAGLQGLKGDTGNAGAAGGIGPAGPASMVAGPQGPAGAASTVPGPQGPAGPTGAAGAASTVVGPQGLKGDTGVTGPAGAASTVAGPQGLKGDTGTTGAASTVAGPQGPAGAASTVAGPQGPAGNTGAQGAQGIQGATGAAGAPLSASAAIGYSTGAGGAVTQPTSRVTGVTLAKASGSITLFNKTTTAGLIESFVVTNSLVAATDTIVLSVKATGIFLAFVTDVAAGSFRISIHTPAAATAQAPIVNFAIIKAVAA